MLTQSGHRTALAAGIMVLGGLTLFCVVSVLSLLSFASHSQDTAPFYADAYVWHIAGFTVYQALLSTVLSVAGGIPLAVALHRRSHFPGRGLILRLMLVPMRLPTLVAAFALITIWGRNGILNQMLGALGVSEPVSIYGLSGILLAHVFFNIPLSAQMMLQGLEQVPTDYWRTAASLGLGPVSTFRFIEWPVVRRLILGLAGLIFILCATSFTLVLVLGGGPQATTLEVAIYQALHFDFDAGRAVGLSVLQIGLTTVLLFALSRFPAMAEGGTATGGHAQRFDGMHVLVKMLDAMVLFLAVMFIASPLAAILLAGMKANFIALFSTALFWQASLTSALLAVSSGALALAVSLAILVAVQALNQRRTVPVQARFFARALTSLPSLVLLVPPVVLATGWFLILPNPADTGITGPVLVMIINAMMALPFCLAMLEPAWTLHQTRTGRLAASLNLTGWNRIRHVDWPCLRPALLRALSLAMALSLGDLGAVALFGGDGFATLPWLLFSKLGSYRSTDADGLALLIAVLCLGLATLGYRAPEKPQGSHHDRF